MREEKVVTQKAVNTDRVVMMGTKGHRGSISEWQPFLIVYFQFVERRLCTHRTRFPLSLCAFLLLEESCVLTTRLVFHWELLATVPSCLCWPAISHRSLK